MVTGVSGHIGNTIARKLVADGKKVRGLVFTARDIEKKLPPEVEVFRADITQIDALRPFFTAPADTEIKLIHSAGVISINSGVQPEMLKTNIEGLRNIIALCLEARARKLVYVSSVEAIPSRPRGELITEVDFFDPELVKSPYAKTKALASQLALDAGKEGLDVSIVHPSAVLGPFDYGGGHVNQMLKDYYTNRLFAGVTGGHDFVDVRDVAMGIIAACERGKPGHSYILSNEEFTVAEVFELLYRITGRRKIRLILPLWLAMLFSPLSEIYYRMRKKPPLFTAHSLAALAGNSLFSSEKARLELGYSTRPLDRSLRETINWLNEESLLN